MNIWPYLVQSLQIVTLQQRCPKPRTLLKGWILDMNIWPYLVQSLQIVTLQQRCPKPRTLLKAYSWLNPQKILKVSMAV